MQYRDDLLLVHGSHMALPLVITNHNDTTKIHVFFDSLPTSL